MPKYTNFSKEESKVYDLTLDLARGNFSLEADKGKVTKKDLENDLRDTIQNDFLHGMTLFQAFRRNAITLFEIVEEIVNVTISEDVLNSPFVDAFVEIKNRWLGDKTAWYAEGELLEVASFSGNHWDTNRQALDLGEEFTLPKEWIYIHVYEELERFLLKITDLSKLTDVVYKSVNKYIKDRLFVQFQNVADAVPEEFSKSGNSEEAVGQLCDLVQGEGGYDSLTIAGTKGALRKLAAIIPDKMFADSQKEAKAQTGSIGEWEGNKLMVIPQVTKKDVDENGVLKTVLALNDSLLYIMSGDIKPIKLEYIGDSRTDMDTTGKKNNDMSVDIQVQTLMAIGLVMPRVFGVFTFV